MEAMEEIQKALELDPLSLIINLDVAMAYMRIGRYDEARQQLMKTLEMEPDYPQTHWVLGVLNWKQGLHEEAFAEYKRVMLLFGLPEIAKALEQGYEQSGFKEAMAQAARRTVAQREQRYIPLYWVYYLYGLAGDDENTFKSLEQAYEERDPMLTLVPVAPVFQRLHTDPRFQDLVQRLNLPVQ